MWVLDVVGDKGRNKLEKINGGVRCVRGDREFLHKDDVMLHSGMRQASVRNCSKIKTHLFLNEENIKNPNEDSKKSNLSSGRVYFQSLMS